MHTTRNTEDYRYLALGLEACMGDCEFNSFGSDGELAIKSGFHQVCKLQYDTIRLLLRQQSSKFLHTVLWQTNKQYKIQ